MSNTETEIPTTPADQNSAQYFGGTADGRLPVDRDELRHEVQDKYAAVAERPDDDFHFHTGRAIAERCRYDMSEVDTLPDRAVESFAGVANPFELRSLQPGERVVDLGSGAGMDSFLAARTVGPDGDWEGIPTGHVVGVDMTPAMLAKARSTARILMADRVLPTNVEFCHGFLEDIPVMDEWADVVISNGVFNLCPDKVTVFNEVLRVLKPGGILQFADIANGAPVPEEARRHIDLWTG